MRVGADDLHPRPVGGRAFALVAASPEYLNVAEACVGRELLGRARLADPRLADQHHQPPAPGQRVFEAGAQFVHLLLAADEDAGGQPVQRVDVGLRRDRCGRRSRRYDRLQRLWDRRSALWPLVRVLGEEAQHH